MLKKRVRMVALSVIMAFSVLILNTGTVNAAETKAEIVSEYNMQAVMIEKLDDFVEVNDDGTLEIDAPIGLERSLNQEDYEALEDGLDNLNDLILKGELDTTDNGTIYEVDDDELVVQGGNVDKVVWHWWGVTRYANNTNSAKIAHRYAKLSGYSGMVCAVSTALAYFLPSATAKAVATCVAAGSGFGWAYWANLSEDVGYYNKGKGVIINITWVLAYSVKSQK